MMTELVPGTYTGACILKRAEGDVKASIVFTTLPVLCDFQMAQDILHHEEMAYFQTLKFEKRRNSYLIGRYAAKQALAAFSKEKDLGKIIIQWGILNQPIVSYLYNNNIQVSITHCNEIGAAVAFPETHPMGIDIEKVNSDSRNVLENQITQREKELIRNSSCSYDRMLTVFWTVKEALSKTLKTGLTTPLSIFELSRIELNHDHAISFFENFGQYKAISFNLSSFVCSLVYPKNAEIEIDIEAIQSVFDPASGARLQQKMTALNSCL